MPLSRLQSISLMRPLRPPNHRYKLPSLRPFTQRTRLLLLNPSIPRAQLPFLTTPSRQPTAHVRLSRLLSTETKKYLRVQTRLAIKFSLYGWLMLALLSISLSGVWYERWDRLYPAPQEWSRFMTRFFYQMARSEEEEEAERQHATNWAKIGSCYRECRKRLEDVEGNGKGLMEQDETAREGVPLCDEWPVGFDLTNMSEEWIRGYHHVLLHNGLAAERLQDQVNDTTRRLVFPKQMMVGPSNPVPRPVPPGAPEAPKEEDCVPASITPDELYAKILTTKGFNTRQRLDAALAYASWLDFKKEHENAMTMYNYAVEIATAPLPNASQLVDKHTILKPSAAGISQNLVDAVTAMALHHARMGNLNAALPILLSVLKVLRQAPHQDTSYRQIRTSNSPIDSVKDFIVRLFTPGKFPPPPPSGNTPFMVQEGDECEEASVLIYVGEILFALDPHKYQPGRSSTEREQGISFSRDAYVLASKQARNLDLDLGKREKCAQCAELSMKNLYTMVSQLEKLESEAVGSLPKKPSRWAFWADPDADRRQRDGEERWAGEKKEVENMMAESAREGMMEMLYATKRANNWLGDFIKWTGNGL